jgi:hypothetical protein
MSDSALSYVFPFMHNFNQLVTLAQFVCRFTILVNKQCFRKVAVHLCIKGVGSDVHLRLYKPEPELDNYTFYMYCTSSAI